MEGQTLPHLSAFYSLPIPSSPVFSFDPISCAALETPLPFTPYFPLENSPISTTADDGVAIKLMPSGLIANDQNLTSAVTNALHAVEKRDKPPDRKKRLVRRDRVSDLIKCVDWILPGSSARRAAGISRHISAPKMLPTYSTVPSNPFSTSAPPPPPPHPTQPFRAQSMPSFYK